jgi:hypothetical protein
LNFFQWKFQKNSSGQVCANKKTRLLNEFMKKNFPNCEHFSLSWENDEIVKRISTSLTFAALDLLW